MKTVWIAPMIAALLGAAALAQTKPAQTAPEPSTVGDIPDNQAFVRYANAAGGYSLEVPEGWARAATGANVRFEAKLNSLSVETSSAASAPSAASLKAELARDPSLALRLVKEVKLPGGSVVLARFDSTSKANEVTGQRVALENDRYVFFKSGRAATLTLSAPKGADNVDAWNRVARSFAWR